MQKPLPVSQPVPEASKTYLKAPVPVDMKSIAAQYEGAHHYTGDNGTEGITAGKDGKTVLEVRSTRQDGAYWARSDYALSEVNATLKGAMDKSSYNRLRSALEGTSMDLRSDAEKAVKADALAASQRAKTSKALDGSAASAGDLKGALPAKNSNHL